MEVENPIVSSPIYPYIHRFLLDNGVLAATNADSQEVFMDLFDVCHQTANDPTPGEHLAERYLKELMERTGNKRYAELIMTLSWVVMAVQEHPTYEERTYTKAVQPLLRHTAVYPKARQLAVKIRQHERHIRTEFYVTPNQRKHMKIEIEGNPGKGNSYTDIHDNHIENLNPNATTVITKHYHFGKNPGFKFQDSGAISDEALEAAEKAMERGEKPETCTSKPETIIDIEPIRQEILTWVSKVRPFLVDSWKADYMSIWEDVLNMQEVKEKIYDPGKQKNTNFNQYLAGNILYYMFEECGAQDEDKDYNASALCMALINTTDHQLRKELAKNPPEEIKNRLYRYFTKKFTLQEP